MLDEILLDKKNGMLRTIAENAAEEELLWGYIVRCFKCRYGELGEHDTLQCERNCKTAFSNSLKAHCLNCPYGKGVGNTIIARLNHWINHSEYAKAEVRPLFRGKSDFELGDCLHRQNAALTKGLHIDNGTLTGWRNGSRDPKKRVNATKTRDNIYRLCSLIGLHSADAICDLFALVFNAAAFTRANELECCIEHFVIMNGEIVDKDHNVNDWLIRAVKTVRIESGEDKLEEVEDSRGNDNDEDPDDEYCVRSVVENFRLSEGEYNDAIKKKSELKTDLSSACQMVETLAGDVWLMINGQKLTGLEEGWTVKNKKVVAPILKFSERDRDDVLDGYVPGDPDDLILIGASNNFPTAKKLNKICSHEASEVEIRRMLILLAFARAFYNSEMNRLRFIIDCNNKLEQATLRRLDVNDGYDALIVYCCCTRHPLITLRRRLGCKPDYGSRR